MMLPILFGIFLYRLDFSPCYPPVPPGVEICFAAVMDDCHYRGHIYRGQDPAHYIEEDPEFLSWDIDDLRIRDWKSTEMLFVKLSGGRCALIFPSTALHIPHRVMRLSGLTTFQHGWLSCTVAWTHIDGNTIHLYQATIKNRFLFDDLLDRFDENTDTSSSDIDDIFAEDLAEDEIAEVARKFKACLRYSAFNKETRAVVERVRLAYGQLWAVLIVYVCWYVLSAIP